MFSDKDLRAIRDAGYAVSEHADVEDLSDNMLLAMLKQAIGLLATRGGTLSPEQFEGLLRGTRDAPERMPGTLATAIRRHSKSQGARIAALEEAVATEQQIARLERHPLEQHIADLERSLESARKERDEALARLPDGMRTCTILFKECENGHGRLTATNWVDDGCPFCDLARLKPSGQVAEDEDLVRECFDHYKPNAQPALLALHRLAAKAQGYEAAMTDFMRLANEAASGSLAPDLYQTNGGRGAAEAVAKTIAARTSEMMTAVADNAALLQALLDVAEMRLSGPTLAAMAAKLKAEPHPGAALLERLKRLEEALVPVAAGLTITVMDQERARYALGNPPMTCENASCLRCRSGWPCH